MCVIKAHSYIAQRRCNHTTEKIPLNILANEREKEKNEK